MLRSELDNLQILLKLSSILSVSPDYKTVQRRGKSSLKSSRFYAITFASIIITGYGMSLDGTIRQKYIEDHDSRIHIILDSVTTLLFTISAVITVLNPMFYYNTWAEFFILIKNLTKATDRSNYSISRIRLNIELFCINAVFGLRFFWSVYAWNSSLGINVSKYYIFRHAIEYFSLISITVMIYLNKIIKHNYHLLNQRAKRHSTSIERRCIKNKLKPPLAYIDVSNNNESGIKSICQNYRKLRRLVHLFNRIFGLQLLLILGITIMAVLEGLNYVLKQTNFLTLSWSGASTLFSLVSLVLVCINWLIGSHVKI